MADWKKLLDDAVSTIGDGVQRAGEGLRELADDARKVAGLGRVEAGLVDAGGARGARRGPNPNPNPNPNPEPAFASIPPAEFLGALDRTLAELRRRGRVVIHEHRAAPVDPAIVMQVLAQHPDLDAELLHFYGVVDGVEIAIAEPRVVAEHYDTVDAMRAVAARWGGTIGSLDEIDNDRDIAPPLFREFCDDSVRVLVIPPLLQLFDDSEDFAHRDGRNVVFGRILLRYGDYFGLVHADVIRSWREPARGVPGRPGYFDDCADAWQACLATREKIHPARWWIVRGDDHGAGLRDPKLLRWSEMLAFSLAHLRG
jgi:hypothetical protein